MAREHHCPNCGPQPCNASTSKIHTCGVCAAIWEEDLSVPVPAPAAPRPAAPAAQPATPAPRPASAAPAAPSAPKPAAPSTPTPGPSATTTQKPAAPQAPAPTPPAAKPADAAPPAPTPAPGPAASKPAAAPSPGGKGLTDAIAGAKVKRCPKCKSDGIAQPSDFRMVQGRVVLVDSQTYRGHEWYADTGELLAGPAKPAPPAPAPSPKPNPAT